MAIIRPLNEPPNISGLTNAVIPGFPRYVIYSNSDVFNTKTGAWLKKTLDSKYYVLTLFDDKNRKKRVHLHIAMLLSFKGERPFPGAQGRHLNDIGTDNRLENLCWGTHKQNMEDRDANGITKKGESHHNSCITEDIAKQILSLRGKIRLYEIAKKFNVSKHVVYGIHSGRTWNHLGGERGVQPKGMKIKIEDARKILELKGKMNIYKIAEMFGISFSMVSKIHVGSSWKELHQKGGVPSL